MDKGTESAGVFLSSGAPTSGNEHHFVFLTNSRGASKRAPQMAPEVARTAEARVSLPFLDLAAIVFAQNCHGHRF
jgi:hypothetical protein